MIEPKETANMAERKARGICDKRESGDVRADFHYNVPKLPHSSSKAGTSLSEVPVAVPGCTLLDDADGFDVNLNGVPITIHFPADFD